jgi:hypothetical protein
MSSIKKTLTISFFRSFYWSFFELIGVCADLSMPALVRCADL